MYTPSPRRGTILLTVILLLISILLEQAIAGVCPWLSQMGGVRPSIVFLDIPLEAPVTIDWLPVGFIFIMFYAVVSLPRGEHGGNGTPNGGGTFSRGWAILGRWWLLLIFLLIGGGIYYGLSGFLPKTIRNGIDSFGMRADLILPYPSGETVHLQGSMILLVFFILGWRLMINKAVPPAVAQPPARVVEEPALVAAPHRGRIAMRIPEPIEVKSPGDRPCVYVAMPPGVQRKISSYPCVVEDGIKPAGIRKKELQQ
jgi:hypothetical protein